MNFEPLIDEEADTVQLNPYSPAEIQRMKDELKTNRARARMLRFELERKRRFRATEEAKQRKKEEELKAQVDNVERIRHNMETKANDVRRETEMREIGELLMQLTNMEEKVTAMRKSTVNDVSKLRDQDKEMRSVQAEFRSAPDDINQVASKKQRTTESRLFAVQRKHNKLKKSAHDAQHSVHAGMKERQVFHEAYKRVQAQYSHNATILQDMLNQINEMNEKRADYLKKAAQNRNASNDMRDELVAKIRTAEQMANVERETRILSVHRAVDRTPYWKSESVNQAIESFWKTPVPPQVTMEKTLHLEETMTKIRHICNVENMSDVIDLYKKREENNELLAERLRDLNKEAETLVDKIEHHHQALRTLDDRAAEFESTAERKMMMLLERTRTMENNGRECQESLEAFKTFYDQLGPTMTSVHEVMFKLIPHNNDIKVPAQPCNGQNYREYQRSFAILAHYFHSIFDYWKQQEHERKSRTDPSYRGTDDDDNPLTIKEGYLAKSDYPVTAKLHILPKNLRVYSKRNEFENPDGTPAVMSVRSMDEFAKREAIDLLQAQTEYLDALDEQERADKAPMHHEGEVEIELSPTVEIPRIEASNEITTQTDDKLDIDENYTLTE